MDDPKTPAPTGRGEAPHVDPRWRALADGSLTPPEADALLAEARQTELGRYLWELFRPLSDEEAATEALARMSTEQRLRGILAGQRSADVATWDRVLP